MNITKFSIENSRPTIGVFLVLIIMGVMSYHSMPRDDMPSFKIRASTIITQFPGASPERMELLVSDKLEKAIQSIPEVKTINSENRTGFSLVTISLKEDVNELQPVWDRIRRKINDTKGDLPDGIIGPTFNDELGDVFAILLGLESEGFSYKEQKYYADKIKDELIKLTNSGKVEVAGDINEKIYIYYDNAKLAEFKLTKTKLEQIIRNNNIVSSGGNIVLQNNRIALEPTGDFKSVKEIQQTLIPTGVQGQYMSLGDLVEVTSGYEDPISDFVKIMGKQGLVIAVNLKSGANITELGDEVNREINKFNESLPYGLNIVRLASQDKVVETKINDFSVNLLESVGIVLIIMLIFLGLRTGLIVSSLIPMTIITTLYLMFVTGLGLNQVTLASLILALGMLVDNAIVVSESIIVKLEKGDSNKEAAISTAKELAIPLLTSSLTTSAAFFSFFLAKSVMGELMGNIFLVVTYALLTSWFVSLTLIPLLCVFFLKIKSSNDKEEGGFNKIQEYYRKIILKVIYRPYPVIASIVIVLVLSILSIQYLPFIFFPDSERALVTVNMNLPLGSRIELTNDLVTKVEKFISNNLMSETDESKGFVKQYSAFLGQGAPKYDLGYVGAESNPGSAHFLINTKSGDVNQPVIDKLTSFIYNELPSLESFTVSRLKGGGGATNPIEIRVSGESIDEIYEIVEKIKGKLEETQGTLNVTDNWGLKKEKIIVNIDRNKADASGITNEDVAISLQTTLIGAKTGEFRKNDKIIPILLKNKNAKNVSIDELRRLNVYSQQKGDNVPLDQIATLDIQWQFPKIIRRNLLKTVTVSSQLLPDFTASDVTNGFFPWLADYHKSWPTGYSYSLGGESDSSKEGMGSIAEKLPISVFIILMLLLSQFNSVRKMCIITFTIPLGLIGCVIGLWIANSYFGFFAFLGLISLIGIIINNGIVLIDRIKIEQDEGKSLEESIISASIQRFRPILLTTFTTSFGLIPLWLDNGMWVPMSVSIIFGLLFGTVLTLIFIPLVYRLMFSGKSNG